MQDIFCPSASQPHSENKILDSQASCFPLFLLHNSMIESFCIIASKYSVQTQLLAKKKVRVYPKMLEIIFYNYGLKGNCLLIK